jgi:hypothetical protein
MDREFPRIQQQRTSTTRRIAAKIQIESVANGYGTIHAIDLDYHLPKVNGQGRAIAHVAKRLCASTAEPSGSKSRQHKIQIRIRVGFQWIWHLPRYQSPCVLLIVIDLCRPNTYSIALVGWKTTLSMKRRPFISTDSRQGVSRKLQVESGHNGFGSFRTIGLEFHLVTHYRWNGQERVCG